MGSTGYSLDSKVTGVVERRIILGFHECELVQYSLAVPRAVHKQLCPLIKSYQVVFVPGVAGVDETFESVPRFQYLIARHRSGHVE